MNDAAPSILPDTITLKISDLRKIIKSACVSAHYLARPDDIPEWSSEQYARIGELPEVIEKPARKTVSRAGHHE